jgi:hypothetical protein
MQRVLAASALAATLGVCGCQTVSGSAAPLTARGFAPGNTPVYVHTVTAPPPGLQMLGLVSARAEGRDASVDQLIPELIRQAQRLGATHLVVDDLHMDYHTYPAFAPFSYRCGYQRCTDLTPSNNEVSALVAHARAFGPPTMGTPVEGPVSSLLPAQRRAP